MFIYPVERFALDNERVRYLTEDEERRLFKAMGDNAQLKDIVSCGICDTVVRRDYRTKAKTPLEIWPFLY